MLERTPRCLEQGGRRLLTRPQPKHRLCRTLHSAFWTHGAGDINLPSWWLALLQRPSGTCSAPCGNGTKSTVEWPLPDSADTGFLDFLYPAKTRALINMLSNCNALRRQARQTYNQKRLLHSHASSTSEEADYDFFPPIAGEATRDSRGSSIQETIPLTTAKPRLKAGTVQNKSVSTEPRPRFGIQTAKLPSRSADHQTLPRSIRKQLLDSYKILHTLYKEALFKHAQYLLHQLDRRVPAYGIRYFAAKTKARFFLHKVTQTVRLYQDALDHHQDHEATPALLRLSITYDNWQMASLAYRAYQRSLQDEAYFWKELQNIDTHVLVAKAAEMADYALYQLKHAPESKPEDIRTFTVKFIEAVFSLKPQGHGHRVPVRLFELVIDRLKDLMAPESITSAQYSVVLGQLLNYPTTNLAETAAFTAAAVRIYHEARRKADVYFEQETLEVLLKRACQAHHRDAKAIYEEVKASQEVSPDLFRAMLAELEYQSNVKDFYDVFDDARMQHNLQWTAEVILQVLQMFARRQQPAEAQKIFDTISHLTGENPISAHWNSLVAAYANAEDLKGAHQVIESMQEKGITVNSLTYEPIFRYHARRGSVEHLDNLCKNLDANSRPSRKYVTSSYVHAHIQNQQYGKAEAELAETLNADFDGDRAPIWGELAIGYAKVRELDKLTRLREKMADAGIPEGDEICQAMILAYGWARRPSRAFKVLTRNMPEKGLPPTAYHYALVMGACIRSGKPDRVPEIERHMQKHGISPDFSVNALLLKAQGRAEAKSNRFYSIEEGDFSELKRAEEKLIQLLENSDRKDMGVAHGRPLIGIGHANYDEAFLGNYINALATQYGNQRGAWARVDHLFDSYITRCRSLNPDNPFNLPIKLLGLLMASFRHNGNFDQVAQGWKLALEKAHRLAARDGADLSAPGWVLPARCHLLAIPLTEYMAALFDLRQLEAVDQLVDDVQSMGFKLNNRNWNLYVQGHAVHGRVEHAFAVAERELMPGWRGWPLTKPDPEQPEQRIRQGRRSVLGTLEWWMPRENERTRCMPSYKTMVVLASAYVRLRRRWSATATHENDLQRLIEVAPDAVREVSLMPRMNDRIQYRYMLYR